MNYVNHVLFLLGRAAVLFLVLFFSNDSCSCTLFEESFSDYDPFWGDLDKLIISDIGDSVFKAYLSVVVRLMCSSDLLVISLCKDSFQYLFLNHVPQSLAPCILDDSCQ
jgi:hypothetical protein